MLKSNPISTNKANSDFQAQYRNFQFEFNLDRKIYSHNTPQMHTIYFVIKSQKQPKTNIINCEKIIYTPFASTTRKDTSKSDSN